MTDVRTVLENVRQFLIDLLCHNYGLWKVTFYILGEPMFYSIIHTVELHKNLGDPSDV